MMYDMKKGTFTSVQVLRGIAASMVVIFHAFIHLEARNIIPELPALVEVGRAGVDIFFVISGFIMVYIGWDKFGTQGASKDFLIRRIIRILPIYWFYTFLMASFLFFTPELVSRGKAFDSTHLLASLFFIPWENNIGDVKPVLGLGWTLNFEMYFYVIFALMLWFRKRLFLPVLTTILLSGSLVGLSFDGLPTIFHVLTSPLLLEFLMGSMIGTVCLRREIKYSPPPYLCALLSFGGAILLVMTGILDTKSIPRIIQWGIPSAMIVGGAVFYERTSNINFHPFLTKLGDSSYSLYLSHLFTINVIGKIWVMILGEMYGLFIIVASVAAMIAGYVAYLAIEKPVTSYLNRLYAIRRARYVETAHNRPITPV